MKKNRLFPLYSILLLTLLFCSGCSQAAKESEEKEQTDVPSGETFTEYFSESPMKLPEDKFTIQDLRITKDSTFLLSGYTPKGASFLWSSEDGQTWNHILKLPEEFPQSLVLSSTFTDDDHLLLTVAYDIHKNPDTNPDIRYYLASTDGTLEEKSLDTGADPIYDFKTAGSTVYGFNSSNQIFGYDYMTGEKVMTFNLTMPDICAFGIADNQLLVIGSDTARIYDINTGDMLEIDPELREDLIPAKDENNFPFTSELAYNPENSILYYTTADGLHTYNFTTKSLETVLVGKAHSFGDKDTHVNVLTPVSDKLYMACLMNFNRSALFEYTAVPDGTEITVPAK